MLGRRVRRGAGRQHGEAGDEVLARGEAAFVAAGLAAAEAAGDRGHGPTVACPERALQGPRDAPAILADVRRALVIARQSVMVLFASALLGLAHAQTKPAADLIVTNAKIWTVDKTRPHAEALAVLGDRIVAVGSSTEVDVWHGPQTKVLDAQGKSKKSGLTRGKAILIAGLAVVLVVIVYIQFGSYGAAAKSAHAAYRTKV